MIAHLIRLLALSCLFLGCTPSYLTPGPTDLVCVNIIDRNGFSETISNPDRINQYANIDFFSPQPYQKVMRIYGRNSQGEQISYITSYHDNSQIKQYLEVVNNRACGAYREWHPNGKLKLEANVINGSADLIVTSEKTWLFDGCNRVWDECGNLEAELLYFKGELEGYSTYYHQNGNIWKRVPFVHNAINGTYEIYLENGELLSTLEYCNGVKHDATIRYWNSDQIAAEEYYTEGLLTSACYYDSTGVQISDIHCGSGYKVLFSKTGVSEMHEYLHGVQEGQVQLYGADGCLTGVYHVREELKHGEEVEYFDPRICMRDMMPKITVNWYEGKIQGQVKTWYPNGFQQSQREMSSNRKNGLSTAWYKDGSLMMIEEYDMNKLVKGEYYKMEEKTPTSTISMGKGTVNLYDAEGNFLRKMNSHNGMPED